MDARRWPTDIQEIGASLAALTLAQMAQLSRYLAEHHGVHPVAPSIIQPQRVEDPTEPSLPAAYRVVLEGYEPHLRLSVIRTVRELTGMGVLEARTFVEAAPQVVREGLSAEDAARVRDSLLAAGARACLG